MRIITFLNVLVVALVGTSTASASELDCKVFGPSSSAAAICEMSNKNEKVEKQIADLNRQLVSIYKKPPEDLATLELIAKEQNAWLQHRDAACAVEPRIFGGDSVSETHCILEMNEQRVQQLKKWINI